MTKKNHKQVTFIQSGAPTMKAGEYTLSVTQSVTVNAPKPPQTNDFTASQDLAVKGERFSFKPEEIHGVFPPRLANGEYEGILPQVVFDRLTLPWERSIESPGGTLPGNIAKYTPWLAVLLFNADEKVPRVKKMTAKDLVTNGQKITVCGSDETGTGTMPAGYLSYPGFETLDYGESPGDECMVIDIDIDTFNKIAPGVEELYYLGHIREVDTLDSEDKPVDSHKYAVVLGNRVPRVNVTCYAFLVSLEKMSDYLPASNGTKSDKKTEGTTHVRLITYVNWHYMANDLDQSFKRLLENLDQMAGKTCSSGLRLPSASSPPGEDAVLAALKQQAKSKTLTPDNAVVLVQNALNQGYVPFNHHLRHGGHTVSWYRGPLVSYQVQTEQLTIPISCPDAANRYNPETGLFDVSYGAAWQLGQLLALQNRRFATIVYNWKKDILDSQVLAQEAKLLNEKLQSLKALQDFLKKSEDHKPVTPPPIPDYVTYWLSRLRLLCGVPFNYLVPNEQMLPPESIRFFHLDMSWVDTLVDGALSIGRSTTSEHAQDSEHVNLVNAIAREAVKTVRPQPKPQASTHVNTDEIVTGFLLRSAVVANWPRLNVNGYNNHQGDPKDEIPKLRMERVSKEVLICLFDGDVKMVAIHEAPETLHCGVEAASASDQCAKGVQFVTTLRAVTGDTPGKQYLEDPVPGHSPNACVPNRQADDQTLKITKTVENIIKKLNNDFGQCVKTFTSAEFALEMIKGVTKVEFYCPPPKENPKWKQCCPKVVQSYQSILDGEKGK